MSGAWTEFVDHLVVVFESLAIECNRCLFGFAGLQEYFPEAADTFDEPYTVEYDVEESVYVVEGPRIEKMLGYTNLDSEKGFRFFQEFIVKTGIQKELDALGIEEGDTVRMYGHSFDYYR